MKAKTASVTGISRPAVGLRGWKRHQIPDFGLGRPAQVGLEGFQHQHGFHFLPGHARPPAVVPERLRQALPRAPVEPLGASDKDTSVGLHFLADLRLGQVRNPQAGLFEGRHRGQPRGFQDLLGGQRETLQPAVNVLAAHHVEARPAGAQPFEIGDTHAGQRRG